MMPPFRDELEAAHERIAVLSYELAALRASRPRARFDWVQLGLFGLIATCAVALVYVVVAAG